MDADGARRYIEEEHRRQLQAFVDAHGRMPMPADSGVDGVREMRLSASYFRLKGNQWLPEILDEPALMNNVMSAGEQRGWTLRETGLVRILFDTGCRVHEACQLSVADWIQSGFMREMLAISKGSHGRRVKRFFIIDRTVKVLRRYVDEQRSQLDPRGCGLTELAELPVEALHHIPLFLTRHGKSLSPDYFSRDYSSTTFTSVPALPRNWRACVVPCVSSWPGKATCCRRQDIDLSLLVAASYQAKRWRNATFAASMATTMTMTASVTLAALSYWNERT
jgi:hypothetical protein